MNRYSSSSQSVQLSRTSCVQKINPYRQIRLSRLPGVPNYAEEKQKRKSMHIDINVERSVRLKSLLPSKLPSLKSKSTIQSESSIFDFELEELKLKNLDMVKNKEYLHSINVHDYIIGRRDNVLRNFANITKKEEFDIMDKVMRQYEIFLENESKNIDEISKYYGDTFVKDCTKTNTILQSSEALISERLNLAEQTRLNMFEICHLNSECIRMEDVFKRLLTSREFFETIQKSSDKTLSSALSEALSTADESSTKDDNSIYLEYLKADKINVNSMKPQELVDLLEDMEINNLGVFENLKTEELANEKWRHRLESVKSVSRKEINKIKSELEKEIKLLRECEYQLDQIKNREDALVPYNDSSKYGEMFNFGHLPITNVSDIIKYFEKQINKIAEKCFKKKPSAALLDTLKLIESSIDQAYLCLINFPLNFIRIAKKELDQKKAAISRILNKERKILDRQNMLTKVLRKARQTVNLPKRRIMPRSAYPRSIVPVVQAVSNKCDIWPPTY